MKKWEISAEKYEIQQKNQMEILKLKNSVPEVRLLAMLNSRMEMTKLYWKRSIEIIQCEEKIEKNNERASGILGTISNGLTGILYLESQKVENEKMGLNKSE